MKIHTSLRAITNCCSVNGIENDGGNVYGCGTDPNATTTPPPSTSTELWQPPQVLFSCGMFMVEAG
jgi:hypothetical protein